MGSLANGRNAPGSLKLRAPRKIKPAHQQVLAELVSVFDGWALAIWFVQPNPWLNDRSPVDLLGLNLSGVLEAARADRFVAAG
ncbi:antitoxin Xre/MbcA/ParS toxin-binding domain-containing protein [Variovorax fucosicus]|uniref:antitoxin Xre/MbcA/ParS toxin-binding domain-containing protein n=1 Tax=Variovorax fucosicus TaxID=3053517 RepID=UPI002577D124|nr:antitoxin Xre/MbcA/ParS toxin-binding domain-containing protein [Variovorax sp. J22G47]MDM0059234.1 DUF2384 domain-containing protein [Variovorax sp. J22G47]